MQDKFRQNITHFLASFSFENNFLRNSPKILRSFTEEAADFSDLLQGRDHPFVIGSQLLYKAIYPLNLLRVSVL